MILFLLDPGFQQQRIEESIAEADVREPGLVEINAKGEMVELRSITSVHSRNAGGEKRNGKSHGAK